MERLNTILDKIGFELKVKKGSKKVYNKNYGMERNFILCVDKNKIVDCFLTTEKEIGQEQINELLKQVASDLEPILDITKNGDKYFIHNKKSDIVEEDNIKMA